jgi:hypothetical protein
MPIKSKMTKKQEQALFQKATEAMQLFAENPDALRGFLNALKNGDFAGARGSINASLDRPRAHAAAERRNVDLGISKTGHSVPGQKQER